jgi:hypothetical protein
MALANSDFEKAPVSTTEAARTKANHMPSPATSWAKAGRMNRPEPNIDDKERMTNVASPMVRESVPLISVETVFKSPDATLFRIFSTDSFAIHVPPDIQQ